MVFFGCTAKARQLSHASLAILCIDDKAVGLEITWVINPIPNINQALHPANFGRTPHRKKHFEESTG
jgi:hypothetical protein